MVSLTTDSCGEICPGYEPTPEEIRVRSQQIRQNWSVRTRRRRRVHGQDGWTVPTIDLSEVAASSGGYLPD